MLALDTNLLLYAYSTAAPEHPAAHAFITTLSPRDDVALSEFSLAEFYLHLRNPAVVATPLSAPAATAVIQSYRHHPRWRILGYPPDSLAAHEALWQHAATVQFARRRPFDTRTAPASAPTALPSSPPPTSKTSKASASPASGTRSRRRRCSVGRFHPRRLRPLFVSFGCFVVKKTAPLTHALYLANLAICLQPM